jgi:hypothetical protein
MTLLAIFMDESSTRRESVVFSVDARRMADYAGSWAAILFGEQLAVRPHADQNKRAVIRFPVNQEQIGFEMALAVTPPSAPETVVAMSLLQGLVISEKADDLRQECLDVPVPRSSFSPLVVPSESGRPLNRSH